jgi:NAD(P) transhydrogenase subunit alpha
MEGQTASSLIVGVPRETAPGERRVAMTPDTVKRLTASGVVVKVESGAGLASGHGDDAYAANGAAIAADAAEASTPKSSSKCKSRTRARLLCCGPARR